jgi:hypothetical protein
MHAFTSDLRTNAIMSPLAKALSAKDIVDVAAYYASLDPPFPPLPSPAPALILDGEQLAMTAIPPKAFRRAKIVMDPVAQASHQRFPISQGSTRSTSLSSCRCGVGVTARTARISC